MSDERLRLAHALHQAGRFAEAAEAYEDILARDPQHFDALLLSGLLHLQSGRFPQADRTLSEAERLNPGSLDVLSMRASALQQMARHEEAVSLLDRILSERPQHATTWNNRGNMLFEAGRAEEAVQSYERAIAHNPGYAEAWHNRGVARLRLADYGGAESDLRHALQLKPDYPDALENLGVALALQARRDDALSLYDAALRLRPGNVALLCRQADLLLQLGRPQEALSSYDQAIRLAPDYLAALNGRGDLHNRLQHYADALADFDRVLAIRRDDAFAWQGRGNALAWLNHDEDAIASYSEALRLRPDDTISLFNRASRYARLARHGEAARDIEALLERDPQYPYAAGLLMHARLHLCNWRGLEEARRRISESVLAGRPAVHPFIHLAFSETASEQLQCARTYAADNHPPAATPFYRGEPYAHEKIRVAYLSGDFYEHAVAFLMAGVFEHHDRDRFETFAVSFSPDDKSAMRGRLEQAFSRFLDVRERSDAETAAMLREMEIDIAVDMKGYTGGARPGILAHRPAPVQAQYLGYPGTMGTELLDYLIADRMVVPEEQRASYSEQVVYLPDMYQCNDARRRIADRVFTRAEAGLPEAGMVFCCFNGSHKIMPEGFRLWMEILAKAEGSVLWLLEEHPLAAANLRREAQAAGIDPKRLVFAKRMPLADHLARLKLADLFLDTLPYSAHTTASDALWAGVPVLTRMGETFAGRVAASLLNAIGLPELIAWTPEDYTARACELALLPEGLAAIKAKLARNRETMPLFDTARVTRNLEAAYAEMHRRYRRGQRPEGFSVGNATY